MVVGDGCKGTAGGGEGRDGSVRHVLRSKNPLFAVALAFALSAVGAGCTTFSDSDAIARVGDTELTQDDFEAELTELGADPEIALDAEAVRGVITTWIVEEIGTLPFDADELQTTYEQGAPASGAACLAVIVVEDELAASSVVGTIDAGTPFDEAFASSNIDPSLTETMGALPCITGADIEEPELPFLVAAAELTADDPLTTSPLTDDAGTEIAWAIVRFRPFDELLEEDLGVLNSVQNGNIDVYVDPRYGVFDRTSSRVLALG